MDKKETINRLKKKIKDCKNTTTIFDTRKYILFDDVIEILQYSEQPEEKKEEYISQVFIKKECRKRGEMLALYDALDIVKEKYKWLLSFEHNKDVTIILRILTSKQ
jgi:hypothetical protein